MNNLFVKLSVSLFLFIFSNLALSSPVALLPSDKTAQLNDVIMIDGSSSFDAGGANLTYSWSIDIAPQGFNSQIDNPANSSISFTVDEEGFYLVRLIVNNGTENSEPAYMVIRVE